MTTQKFSTVKENADVAHDNHLSPPAPKKDSIDEAIEAALKKSNSPNCDKIVVRQDSIDEVIEATVLKYSSQDGATGGPGRKHRRRTKSESLIGSSSDQVCVASPSKEDAIGKRNRPKGAQGEMSSPAGGGTSPGKSPGRKSNDGVKALSQPQPLLDSLVALSSSSDDEDTGIGNEEDFSDDEDEPLLTRLEKHAPASHNPAKRTGFQKKSSSPSASKKAEAQTTTVRQVEDGRSTNRADFETQVDLPSSVAAAAPVKKMTTFDVGTQVEAADTLEFANAQSTGNIVTSSEIAIQATGPDDADEVLKPSVNSATDTSSVPRKDVFTSEIDSSLTVHPSVEDSTVNPSVVEMSEPDDCDDRTSAASPEITVEPHTSVIRHTKVGQTSPVTKQPGDHPVDGTMTTEVKVDCDDVIVQEESKSELPAGRRTRRMRMVQRTETASSVTRGVADKKSDNVTEKRPQRQVSKSKTKSSTKTSDSIETCTRETSKQKVIGKSAGLSMEVTRSDVVVVDVTSATEREKTASGCAECAALQRPVRGHGRRGRRRPNQTRKTCIGVAKVDSNGKTGMGGAKVDSNCIVMLDRLESVPSGGANHPKPARERTKQGTRRECGEVASTEPLSTEDVVVLSVQPPENVTIDTETSQPILPDDHNDVESVDNDANSIAKDDDSAADVIIIDDASDQANESNSEYEPLPVQQQQQQKRRKRRIWPGHDMGYSKPRRKRRRKKQTMPAEGADATMAIVDEDSNETR